jgi:phosphomannomutase
VFDRIFKAYDVRGTVPTTLDARAAWCIGRGVAQHLAGAGNATLVVGRDARASSPELAAALMAGMESAGATVVDIGLVDTPLVGFTVRQLNAAGGVQVTASHNPAQDNGFKVCGPGARPVGAHSGLREVQRLAEAARAELEAQAAQPHESPSGAVQPGAWPASRARRMLDPWPAYRTALHAFVPPALMRGDVRLRVAVDASNGSAGAMLPHIAQGVAGLEIVPLHFEHSEGRFVHEPNPLVPANLRWLQRLVVSERAHLGVCFDGDADRSVVVDEQGDIVGCDLLTAWLARAWLARAPGSPVVFDLRASRAVREAIVAAGGQPVECRVGHVFMKDRMRECDAAFGGELSGHFYYRDMGFTDNGARAFLDVLATLVECGGTMSQAIAPHRRYVQSGELNFRNPDAAAALAALRARYPLAKAHTLDGLTLETPEWWCNVRTSNTEPLLRLNLEAHTPAALQAALREMAPMLGHPVDH